MSFPGRGLTLFVAAGLLLLLVILGAALFGAASIPLSGIATSAADRLPFIDASSGLTSTQEAVLWEIRVPRILMAALVGASLAIAGAGYQGVFRNPLVDPYLLGAAAGAGLAATTVIALWPQGSATAVPIAAFAGATAGVLLAYGLAVVADPARSNATLVLSGVAVAAFLTSVQTFILQQNSESLRSVYGWILGQLGRSSWSDIALVAPYMIVSWVVLLAHARWLDVLSTGDDKASSLGVKPERLRLVVIVAASLATAAAVAASGLIAFVGLVVPHMVRRIAGYDNRVVLPLSLLGGAAFLVLADTVARTALSPQELPIGVITAFLGAPFFAYLLRRSAMSLR